MNNYEKQLEDWRLKFLTMNADEICKKLPEINKTDTDLTLWHYGRQFSINRFDGIISVLSDDKPLDITPQLNVYTLFWYVSPTACLSGEWVPFRELKSGSPFATAFQNGILTPLAATFSGKQDRLEKSVEALRGKRLSSSSFLLPAFDCIPVKLLFWDADDEFPAQANLLFDKSATDFIHVESVVTIAAEALYQLAETAGLPILGNPFFRF
ncbi:DUF3786 domain-containing protein [Hominifimenecus sp. rT4P-3]|uniref:DUF3786 domain-containing protein n=1 Tax=Hominifimenecus sp. rT4P-3 TaxID=3242979 RepID=UPI003DA56C13